ncbi:MAG: hypothetical protein NVSMB6_13130 [Burkholderiaceae bacterium]
MNPTRPIPSLPDFDTLMHLHRRSPDAFEALRIKLLNDCIARSPAIHHATAKRLVVRMEEVRANAKTPLEAAVAAARLMVESMVRLQAPLDALMAESASYQTTMLLNRLRAAR